MGKHLAPPPKHPPLWRRLLVRLAGGLLVALVIVGGLIGGLAVVEKKNAFNVVADFVVPKPQDFFHKDRITVLIVGLDYDYSEKDEEFSKNARTDTIITTSLNFPTQQVQKPSVGVLSVPRDMLVTYPNGRHDKINGAYSIGGIAKSEATIADFLNLPGFDRYVILRIDSTKALISAIGGIDIVPDETMNYDDSWGHLHIHFKEGVKYHMSGEQAVAYARFRHDACGDPCRIKRQQQVIRTAIAKLKNDKFNDLIHIRDLAAVLQKNVETNFKTEELVSIGNAFSQIDLADVAMNQVPFKSDEDLGCCGNVLLVDADARAKLVHKIFLDPILPPVDARSVAAVPASKIKVEIYNGSGISGLATKMAAVLKKRGFVVASIGNADAFNYETTQIQTHSAAVPLAGERVRSALALATASVSPNPSAPPQSATSDVTVIVGRDFNGVEVQASAAK